MKTPLQNPKPVCIYKSDGDASAQQSDGGRSTLQSGLGESLPTLPVASKVFRAASEAVGALGLRGQGLSFRV